MKHRIYIGKRKAREKENRRVKKFFCGQIKKGWRVEYAFQQVENLYGAFFKDCLRWDLQEYYNLN